MSTGEGVQLVESAKRKKLRVTAETCPHYLAFSKKDLSRFGPLAKYNPPPRSTKDIASLWKGLKTRVVDTVASDHAPHAKSEKDSGKGDIWKAPPGTPGVELRLPFLLTRAPIHGMSLSDVVRTTSTKVARIFGVDGIKGDIRKGLQADLTIVDPKSEWVVRAEDLKTKARETNLYDGMKMRGRIKWTVLRGTVVYEDGVGFTPGLGNFLPGPQAAA